MKRTYIKPIHANADEWVELELTPTENFFDDIRRFGLGKALRNVIVPALIGDMEESDEPEFYPARRVMTAERVNISDGLPEAAHQAR